MSVSRPSAPPGRVLLWCPSRDGHLRYTLSLARGMAAHLCRPERYAGPSPVVLTTQPRGRESAECFPVWHAGHEIRNRLDFPSPLAWAADRVTRRLTLERLLGDRVQAHPEVVLVHLQEIHTLTALATLRRLQRRLRRPVVYTLHNVLPHRMPFGLSPGGWASIGGRILRRFDGIIVHSAALRDEAIDCYGLRPERVFAVPHGVWADVAAGRPDGVPDPAGAVATGPAVTGTGAAGSAATAPADAATPERIRLIAFGQIRPNKGLHHLLDALLDAPIGWELLVAGGLDRRDYWRQMIVPRLDRLLAQGRRVRVRNDWIDPAEVPRLFRDSHVVVLPYDGFHAQSGVLFDAIAHGRPVVAPRGGTLGRTVAELSLGALADTLAPADLRAAIARAAALPPGPLAAAFEHARRLHSWEHAGAGTLRVYDEVLRRHRAGRPRG